VLSRSGRRSGEKEDKPGLWAAPSTLKLAIGPGDVAEIESERGGARLRWPLCCVEVVSAGGATVVGFLVVLSEDDDDRDCWDVLEWRPTERFARAAFVFSRAIAAIDNLL